MPCDTICGRSMMKPQAAALAVLLLSTLASVSPAADRDDAFVGYKELPLSDCRDLDSSCPDRAKAGDCRRGLEFMQEKCKMSCGGCVRYQPPPARSPDPHPSTLEDLLIVFDTDYGRIPIQPYWEQAPKTTASVLALARKGCEGCSFYRNEAVPSVGSGPPYGLLQGSLRLANSPAQENKVPMGPRMAGFIGGSNDFFIAVADHRDWGGAFVVWGEVTDMRAVHTMVHLGYHEYTHPEFGTVMRMLNTAVVFNVSVVDKSTAAAEAVIAGDRRREAASAERGLEVGDLAGGEEGGGDGGEELSEAHVEGVEQGLGDVESA